MEYGAELPLDRVQGVHMMTAWILPHPQTMAYAGDMAWALIQPVKVPYITKEIKELPAPVKLFFSAFAISDLLYDYGYYEYGDGDDDESSNHWLVTTATWAGVHDFEDQVVSWCMATGQYIMMHADEIDGDNRPGGYLDKTAGTHGWFGGTISVEHHSGCVYQPVHRNASQDSEVLFELLFVGGGVDGEMRTDSLTGECISLEEKCGVDDATLLETFTADPRSLLSAVDGMPSWMLYERVCGDAVCANSAASEAGVQFEHCCKPYSGHIMLNFSLPYTGFEAHIPVADSEPRRRYLGVSGSNRVLAGMLLTQERYIEETCSTQYDDLSGTCHAADMTSDDPYGVDPVFLVSSELFRKDLAAAQCCNISTYTA
eukprot:gene13293-15708_t